jgi:Domain of unknown function (DUF4329)
LKAKSHDRTNCLNDPVNFVDPWGLAPGDHYGTQDAAAIDAIDSVMSISKAENREYGGWVYYNKGEKFYSYTAPMAGDERSMNVDAFNQPSPNNRDVAIYHTHPGEGYSSGYFSTADYLVSGFRHVDIYLGTSSGLIKVWSPKADDERKVRCGN